MERCATTFHGVARSVTWLSGVEAASDGVPSFRFPHQRECGAEGAEEMERATTAERRRRLKRPAEVSEAPLSRDHAATTRLGSVSEEEAVLRQAAWRTRSDLTATTRNGLTGSGSGAEEA